MTCLVVDIETDDLDLNTSNIKWVFTYDGNNVKVFDYEKEGANKIRNFIMGYDKVITFNGNRFDIPILKNHNIIRNEDFFSGHFIKGIDIYEIFKKRGTLIFSRGFPSLSLKAINQKLFPESKEQKGEINFNLFKKKNLELTKEELDLIIHYGTLDVKLTWKLWDFLVDFFEPFGEFVSKEDYNKLKHITCSTATFAYKAICKGAGIQEIWGDCSIEQDTYIGAYVLTPPKEVARGNILYLDYSSLYPMVYVHNNLFSSNCSCCSKEEKWHGNNKWKLDGYYCSKNSGKIEETIKKFYLLRKKYKKDKDKREQSIKIILNSLYGSSARPGFVQTYSPTTASDCTKISQQIIKYSMKKLEEAKFGAILMSDTDSIVLELAESRSVEECLEFCKNLSQEISSSFPFPFNEFNLKLEAEIKYFQFFKGDKNELLKKNYLYVTNDNKIVVKGLPIIEKSCSQLSQLIFEKYLKQQIIDNLDCKFSKKYISNLVEEELKKDLLLIAKKFDIKEKYKSETTMYNEILKRYGSGEFYLVKNHKLGAGKGIKYCSIEEAKQLRFQDLDLSDIWSEMDPFFKSEQMQLYQFGITKSNFINLK